MSYADEERRHEFSDTAPGDEPPSETGIVPGLWVYLFGFALSSVLTIAAFGLPNTLLVWGPGIPVALVALAIAQIGVHLVFFLHITTGPDSTNNALALAFGVLIVMLLIGGSLWIMANLNHNLMPKGAIMQMQP
jgi:cytochrome o ubiquinol oxidase operon protein cyoD